jgi:hypothetical protein
VSSSSLAEIGYHPPSQTLEVMFHDGRLYQYFDVPRRVYEAFIGASSIGTFFNKEIKDLYRYARL